MGRLFLALLIGIVGAAVVHIAVIFAIPRVAEDNAWGRLSRVGAVFEPVRVPTLGSDVGDMRAGFAFVDPSFLTYACRFSVAAGPVRLLADGQTSFWSASIYSRSGDNLYSTNRRVAPDGVFDLLVGSFDQLETIRLEGSLPGDNTVPVTVAVDELYLTLRAVVDDESERPFVEAFMDTLSCDQVPLLAGAAG